MPRVSEIKSKYIKAAQERGIERSEAIVEFEMTVKYVCDCSIEDILLDFEPDEQDLTAIEKVLKERILTRRPIQHLLGVADFLNEEFYVNEHTLIPRPETELLVMEAVNLLQNLESPKVLDIGTGSGNIACSIAKRIEDVEVIGVDISTKALQVAIKNADKLGVVKKAIFRKSNIFSNVSETFDMIVSNPPYIPRKDQSSLQEEVRNFEPEKALFTNDDKGLEFYSSIIADAANYLNLEGYLLFETGMNQAEAVEELLVKNYFRIIRTVKDFNDIERVIIAQID